MITPFELTVVAKDGGSLSKLITLVDGKSHSDGSPCVMSRGRARRVRLTCARHLAELIAGLEPHQAITSGTLRADLGDELTIVTKSKLNGSAARGIARTAEFFGYRRGAAAAVLVDFDQKGMPPEMKVAIREAGGLWPVLAAIVPELETTARVIRNSTSAGLYRADTGEQFDHSGGLHVYLLVKDGADAERFLKTLHERCWLASWGWYMLGRGGQLLERSIVDRVVGSPERLIFEGPAELVWPLKQDQESRRPVAIEGEALDTAAACPPLGIVDQARLRELQIKASAKLAPEAAKVRKAYIEERAAELATKPGAGKASADDLARARRITERQCDGFLMPGIVLPFDDPELTGKTVADVLADPERYIGETLADPVEGFEYGHGKARIMPGANSIPWIHSFAHGRTVYELQHDFHTAKVRIEDADHDLVVDLYVDYALSDAFAEDEVEKLKEIASKKSGVGARPINERVKREAKERAARSIQEERAAGRKPYRPPSSGPGAARQGGVASANEGDK